MPLVEAYCFSFGHDLPTGVLSVVSGGMCVSLYPACPSCTGDVLIAMETALGSKIVI